MAPNTVPSIPAKRILASKEAALFKELLTLYETKQLKKGLKAADQILKKFPEHGETLCMKGLVLTHLDRREEGLEQVKKGVRLDLTSHICWHVFGLIQKGQKNYEEALKSYTQALRFDKENLNLLREAAHLQTQLRAFDALVETRHALLKIRPNLRQNWVALAVAYHLIGKLEDTKKVLEQYESTLKDVPDYDVEHSETMLYHVRVLEDLGETSEALSLLDVSAKSRAIVDRTAIMEIRARLLSRLESRDEAEHAWRALIEQNPENHSYYKSFFLDKSIDFDRITDNDREIVLNTLSEFSQSIPRATAPRRLVLSAAIGEQFREFAKAYLISGLTKGIPSLFADVKALYRDPQKQQAIEETVEELRESLASSAEPSSSPLSEPTTYLWTLYFLAQHYSFLSKPARALERLDTALTHTPTLPELHTCKARVLKRAGDLLGAARCLNDARLLDGQDRYLNTKCAKYRLRAGLIQEASDILGLFTKKDAISPGTDLEDMQSFLYLLEEGDAHHRSGKLNLALKKYTAVQKIFDVIEDDQFDFHGYSLRKFTINVYLSLLTWEDQVRSHPAYVSAALSASRIYVAAHDDPSIVSSLSGGGLTEAEKKAKKKAKKAAAQKTQGDPKKALANASTNEDKGLEPPPPKDDDPDGTKLLSAPDGLERAAKWLQPLAALPNMSFDVWIAIFDVAIRRHKFLEAIKALNSARVLDADHPELHLRIVRFQKTFSSLSQPLPEPVHAIVVETSTGLLPSNLSLETYNSQYLQQHPSGPVHLAVARAAQLLDAPLVELENIIFSTLEEGLSLDIKTAVEAISLLEKLNSKKVDEYRTACDRKFELSTVFKTPAELAVLKEAALAQSEPAETETAVTL